MQKEHIPLKIISKIISVHLLRGWGGGEGAGNQAEELINYSIA